MRQFFITIPVEVEEAALIDGASRLQILTRIFLPASTPALATLTTFMFLYAWNSFFWPLVVINTGNGLKDIPSALRAVELAGTRPLHVAPELTAVQAALEAYLPS